MPKANINLFSSDFILTNKIAKDTEPNANDVASFSIPKI